MTTPILSVLHATARLPHGWQAAAFDWFKKCDQPDQVEYVLAIDQCQWTDRPHQFGPEEFFGNFKCVCNTARECPVDAYNLAAEQSTGKLLVMVSDDYFCPQHWDTALLAAVPDLNGEHVLDVDNCDNSYPLLPFSMLTRSYYERLGYMFHPDYWGNQADNEFSDVARRDGVVVDARHIKFEHCDPQRGGVWDACYEKQRVHNRKIGINVYERRKAAGFPSLEVKYALDSK